LNEVVIKIKFSRLKQRRKLQMFHRAIFLSLTAFFLVSVGWMTSAEKTATVKGYVLDSACAFTKNLDKPISSDCALSCAKAGSPLVILSEDGKIYLPISKEMPAKGQNGILMKWAGQKVMATGSVYQRSGSHAIVIEKVEAASSEK
jgi:predicted lipoprotein with Yx(FWY)xxD motif